MNITHVKAIEQYWLGVFVFVCQGCCFWPLSRCILRSLHTQKKKMQKTQHIQTDTLGQRWRLKLNKVATALRKREWMKEKLFFFTVRGARQKANVQWSIQNRDECVWFCIWKRKTVNLKHWGTGCMKSWRRCCSFFLQSLLPSRAVKDRQEGGTLSDRRRDGVERGDNAAGSSVSAEDRSHATLKNERF